MSGHTYEETARRELKEELSINVAGNLTVLGKDLIHFPQESEIMTTFRYDTLDSIIISKEEVDAYQFYSINKGFFNEMLPNLKITPDLRFVLDRYMPPAQSNSAVVDLCALRD